MPTYEYRCLDCQKKFEIRLSYQDYGTTEPECPHCHTGHVQRVIGRIRFARSNDSRMAELADPAALDRIEDDPQALGHMMRRMSSELGEDMGGEFNEVVSRLEAGQSPEQIEKELPDIGDSSPGSSLDSVGALGETGE